MIKSTIWKNKNVGLSSLPYYVQATQSNRRQCPPVNACNVYEYFYKNPS